MSCLSVNSLFDYGYQVYSTCASFRDKTLDACQQVAKRTWNDVKVYGMHLGYRIGHPTLLNLAVQLNTGLSIEEMKVTELHLSARLGTTADIDAILAKGADVNGKDWIGCTPLHYTALRGYAKSCRSLLDKGADVEAKEKDGKTPLHTAARHGKRGAVRALLKAGANFEAKDSLGLTSLHYAAVQGHTDIIKDLLQAGASHAAKTELSGDTPLHLAARNKNNEAVRALIAGGADIYALNSSKKTPSAVSPSLEIDRILSGFESHPAFVSYAALHDYCDKLFPASRDRLPKEWEIWQEKLKTILRGIDPFQELREVLKSGGANSFEKVLKTTATLQADSPTPLTLESIILCLIQDSPVFAKAWSLVNRDEKLKLVEMTAPDQLYSPASYLSDSHAIHIHQSVDLFRRIGSIIFEVINAVQREKFLRIHQLGELGNLSREEYTLFKETIEYETLWWSRQIKGESLPDNFSENWKLQNTPYDPSKELPQGRPSHADAYRKQWEHLCAAPYLKKHPELDTRAT